MDTTSSSSTSSSTSSRTPPVVIHVFLPMDPVQLIVSKITIGPCGALIVFSTFILFYLILKHFTALINLYFSLLFYASTQVIFLLILVISPVLQSTSSAPRFCPAVSLVEVVVPILPCYGVLLVTAAKWVCVEYPFKFRRILSIRRQIMAVTGLVLILGLVASLPVMGFCQYSWKRSRKLVSEGYCGIGEHNLLADRPGMHIHVPDTVDVEVDESGQCVTFMWLVVVTGYILPFLGVLIFYVLIGKVLILHKRKERTLGKYQGTTKATKVDFSYKPVTITEKLSQLRSIGEDAIPWSLVVILALNTLTTLLWIPQMFYQDLYYNSTLSDYLILDLVNSMVFIGVSVSPLAYILSTPAMRVQLIKLFKQKLCGSKQFTRGPAQETEIESKPNTVTWEWWNCPDLEYS